jgi:hypothetical protein
MRVKEEHKGKVISINDGILGMIKIDLNTIKPMQERRLIALGYTHLFEDEKVETHEPELIEEMSAENVLTETPEWVGPAVAKKIRKKKAQ